MKGRGHNVNCGNGRAGEEATASRRGRSKEARGILLSLGLLGFGRGEKGKAKAEEWTAAKEQQTPGKGNKRKMVGREEVEAKRRRIDKESGVAMKCSQEQRMEKRQTPAKGNKRMMVGRQEVEAKRRRIDKEAGVAVKCSEEQGMEERQTPLKGNKRKMVGREEVEAKRRRIDKEAGVAVKCSQEQGMEERKTRRKGIKERLWGERRWRPRGGESKKKLGWW